MPLRLDKMMKHEFEGIGYKLAREVDYNHSGLILGIRLEVWHG